MNEKQPDVLKGKNIDVMPFPPALQQTYTKADGSICDNRRLCGSFVFHLFELHEPRIQMALLLNRSQSSQVVLETIQKIRKVVRLMRV